MIVATRGQNHAITRSAPQWGTAAIPPPGQSALLGGIGGGAVDAAYSLPAFGFCISLIRDGVGMLPALVYRDLGADMVERARDSWQWRLLHDEPHPERVAIDWYTDTTAALLGFGNSYHQKLRARSRVEGLEYLPPDRVEPKRTKSGLLYYEYRTLEGKQVELDAGDVLHIRGYTVRGEDKGVTPVGLYRRNWLAMIGQTEFQRGFFDRGARPGVIVKHPAVTTEEQADEWLAKYEARHQGVANSHRPMIVPAGADITPVSMSLEDMAFVELAQLGNTEAARIFKVPGGYFSEQVRPGIREELAIELVTHAMGPWLKRIEQRVNADPDIFGAGSSLYLEFLADGLLRASTQARFAAYVQARQAGWLSINDIRRLENLPPIEGGDVYQVTPVGGAPNLQPGAAAEPADQPGDTTT